ncbi:membrane protein [Caldovatus sediminis]|uniref:Membrane protein n=1 Tax=Caldovatus sediminis TaxID=2041189 RepID=A0A8J2ZCS9_9PROT|nr:DUF445 domain-containing protein [Caldovatus sediminis]GGG40690.1 membrane protein [Caldovatus sediminis]
MQGRHSAPRSFPDPETELRRTLARHRAVATGLLTAMGGLVILAYYLPPGYWTDLLQAGAKAGLVGGLADWFAVTALFRRPLGLPIPHTAIIPRQKDRLGRALGSFVANHVFTEQELNRVLGRLDLASILRGFLNDAEATRPAATALAAGLPRVLASLEDGRARRLAQRLLPRWLGGPAAAQLLARSLRALVASGRHQQVLDLVLARSKALLAEKEEQLREAIEARVRAEGGALVGWIAGAAIARRILAAVNEQLARVEPSDSELRAAFDAWVQAEIERLETDPERAAAIGRALRGAFANPAVASWLGDVWARLRAALEADATNPSGRTVAALEAALANAGRILTEDEAARERLNRGVEHVLLALLPTARLRLAEFIAEVVQGWDSATVVEKIELRVGRDLQYVRMNGTLVGFLAGAALFALLSAVFGRVAY